MRQTPLCNPKRLIEVDLPIKQISEHARGEKAVRQGVLSSLHLWWARRPGAACRAVLLASLLPDPVELAELAETHGDVYQMGDRTVNPGLFLAAAGRFLKAWADSNIGVSSPTTQPDLLLIQKGQKDPNDPSVQRRLLLHLIADFADTELSANPWMLNAVRDLCKAASVSLGGGEISHSLDPFAGGGAIPFESLRLGLDTYASDLNPVAVLLNKVAIDLIPRFGQSLSDEFKRVAGKVVDEARRRLSPLYKAANDIEPISFIMARTIVSSEPGVDEPVEIPLLRSMWLSKKGPNRKALRWKRDSAGQVICNSEVRNYSDGRSRKVRIPLLEIFEPSKESDVPKGTVARGSVTCPVSGYTTSIGEVRRQLSARFGGACDARLVTIAFTRAGQTGRGYALPTKEDFERLTEAARLLKEKCGVTHPKDVIADVLPLMSGVFNAPLYGHCSWGSLYTCRQMMSMLTICDIIADICSEESKTLEPRMLEGVRLLLGMALDKQADLGNALCTWEPIAQCPRHLFGRQAIGMVWDFAESVPTGTSSGSFEVIVNGIGNAIEGLCLRSAAGHVERASATHHPLPDDSVDVVFTDPPYYNAVPYADLSDFFYVWLKRSQGDGQRELLLQPLTPKDSEICEMAGWAPDIYAEKTAGWFEKQMTLALTECRRILNPNGIAIIVFAHKATSGWEAMLQALIEAGWRITASWPIDTENTSRLRAQGAAALGSSVHLVCRPREDSSGNLISDSVGEWRDVIDALGRRIKEWMIRLTEEKVVGADAIFSCIGPALEEFSRYSRVERSNGDVVTLREYLEQVWATVANEAVATIFSETDVGGLEPDARLTAMWLWTVNASSKPNESSKDAVLNSQEDEFEDGEQTSSVVAKGIILEYDTARKIAQGLGIHLDKANTIVEIKKDKARLLPVAEREQYLFKRKAGESDEKAPRPKKGAARQLTMFPNLNRQTSLALAPESPDQRFNQIPDDVEIEFASGKTVLDQVHQAMILFGDGRAGALRRFLIEAGVGKDDRFWRLSQSLSALYPSSSEEKRWVDGVLARKKSLGL